ncbi:uncharacterized protein [Aristolochia californica]|uniref:uncharacterized protein n=1 Tax=Aristolochia californica TaxID=171875 RepID=UPI0035E19488
MGFDFHVEYKPGHLNRAVDALSHKEVGDSQLHAISQPRSLLLNSIQEDIQHQPELLELYDKIEHHTMDSDWAVQDHLVVYKSCIYLHPTSALIPSNISSFHHSTHEGQQKTYFCLRRDFYWRGMKRMISEYVAVCQVAVLDQALEERDTMLSEVRAHLQHSQDTTKQTYDKGHCPLSFAPGDYVWLKLQPYRKLSLAVSKRHKLSPKFYGPFQVLQRIGNVAYHLQLPPNAKLHDVFHVSLSKPFRGDSPLLHTPLPPIQDGRSIPTPTQVLQARCAQGSWEVLVQWTTQDLVEDSWEPLESFQATFKLEDKLFL